MSHPDEPDDQPSAALNKSHDGPVDPTKERADDPTASTSCHRDDTPTPPQSAEPQPATTLPRHVRRRAAREQAKRGKRSERTPPQSAHAAADADGGLSLDEWRDHLLDRAATEYRRWRKGLTAKSFTSPESVLDPGLVIIRADGEENDDRMMFSVHARIARWCGAHDEIAVCMLDGIVYDTLPVVFVDPFQELRASPLTGASTSDEAFGITAAFYAKAYAALSRRSPFLTAEHGHDLLQRIREAESGDSWKYQADTPLLSMLAQRVLLYVLYCVNDASDGMGTLDDVRRLIAHGRLLECIDPRDGQW